MCGGGDFRGFALGAVVAPQVVVVERFKILAYRNYGRPRGIKRDGYDLIAGDARLRQRRARDGCQRLHVVGMGLRGKVRILRRAMKRIFHRRRFQHSLSAVHYGRADTERSEVYSDDNRHQQAP